MSDSDPIVGYCFKCKEKRELVAPKAEWSASGAPGTRGTCAVCEGTIYKMGHTPAHDALPKPEITAKPKKRKKASTKKKGRKSSAKRVRRSGKLVIVESPAKAKTIGRYLGKGYTVKSSVGHVRDLLRSRLSVDVDNNFTPEYRVPNNKRPVVKELKEAAAKATEIYLATDPDREGEAIAWHVLESAEMEPARTKRVVFHEITKNAILEAFESPREIDMQRVDAQQARRILDRLVGYKLSPLLWRKVRGRLSAGRVQSVAVRLVVEREREIDAFEPVEYWTIDAELGRNKQNGHGKPQSFMSKLHRLNGAKPELGSKEDVDPHLEALKTAVWTVGEVRLGTRRRKPAAPFTTSTMQQEASRKLNFGTSKTMRIAQQLYEGVDIGNEGTTGLITYMRTDSVTVSAQAQQEARTYVTDTYGPDYLPAEPPVYKTRSKTAQEAHEAVRPTGVMRSPKLIKSFLSRDQYRLYNLIWSRFVASQMAPAVYNTVSADIYAGEAAVAVKKRPYLFRATGSDLKFSGFLALYEETEPSDRPAGGGNQVPSDLTKEELVNLLKILPEQHFTQPPPRYSEATLVKTMEEFGIGRPSTYAATVSTVQQRGYVVKDEKRLYPTETGQVVNDLLVEYFPNVLSVDFTARMEENLDTIAEGKPWVPVLEEFYGRFAKNLAIADEAIEKVDLNAEPELVGRDCPTCDSELIYRQGRFGRFIGCSNFPSCRHTEQVLVKTGVVCQNGGEIIERKTKRGRTFYGCSRYPDCDWTSWKPPVNRAGESCEDGGIMVQVNKTRTDCVACGLKVPVSEPQSEEAAVAD